MTELIARNRWHTHELVLQATLTDQGRRVPFFSVIPTGGQADLPCILALHGFTSSKAEWLEMGGFTKGGNLVKALADQGYAVVGLDLYGHGDHQPDLPANYDELANDRWEEFFHGSLVGIAAVLEDYILQSGFNKQRLGFLSYSIGGIFGFWLANRGAPFIAMAMCVPPVDRDLDDEYAALNNLDLLAKMSMLIIAAQEDENIKFTDSEWLFNQLPLENKRFVSYHSGHSLPDDYVPVAADWFQQHL
jgi:pimeloyl-ACP methyl ester carboxylesterase